MSIKSEKKLTIASLYPELTSAEQDEAGENLRRYLAVVKRIFDHISEHNPEILTELRRRARLRRRKQV